MSARTRDLEDTLNQQFVKSQQTKSDCAVHHPTQTMITSQTVDFTRVRGAYGNDLVSAMDERHWSRRGSDWQSGMECRTMPPTMHSCGTRTGGG